MARQGPPGRKHAQVGGQAGLSFVRRRAGPERRDHEGLPARLLAVVAAAWPAATRNTPARIRKDPALVQTHGDLPGQRGSVRASSMLSWPVSTKAFARAPALFSTPAQVAR